MQARLFRVLFAAMAFAGVAVMAVPPARAETAASPLRDPAVLRIREAFAVDGIALFDAHSRHAARIGACTASVFAGLKWCVSGKSEETKGAAAYVKTTGYNIDAENRVVYAISTRRGYPLKREGFDAVVQSISARFGAGAAVYALHPKAADGNVPESLIAVWGGLRLVHLSEAEYAVVESGGSLKRGHLVDHRFDLAASAKARDPIYKVEGTAGYILHFMAVAPDHANIVARAIYPSAFLPPPPKPSDVPSNPLAADAVKPPQTPLYDRDVAAERGLRAEAERALAAERRLREDAERKLDALRRAHDELRKRSESGLTEKDALLKRTQVDRKPSEPARGIEGKRAAIAKRIADDARVEGERRQGADAERKARDDRAKPPESGRAVDPDQGGPEDGARPDDEQARRAESERTQAEAKRKAEAEHAARAARDRAARTHAHDANWQRRAAEAAAKAGATWSFNEVKKHGGAERILYAQAIFAGAGGTGVEILFECKAGTERRLRATARGFDRNSGSRVPFRSEGAGAHRARSMIGIDDKKPEEGFLVRESDDDVVSILEVPLIGDATANRSAAHAAAWLRHYAVTADFHLMAGTVTATVAPYDANLRRVLEACAKD